MEITFMLSYQNQQGRSMVEMLGVLAIIGVLSVGAVSGYSKAMRRYKLNKQSAQLTQLLNALYQYKAEWTFDGQTKVDLIPYYEALGEIPKEMLTNQSSNSSGKIIYDVFNSAIQITTNGTWSMGHELLLSYQIKNNNAFDICLNASNIASMFSNHLLYIGVAKTTANSSSNQFYAKYFGNSYCKQAKDNQLGKCMSEMTMQNIADQCEFCKDSNSCVFRFQFVSD